MAWEYVPLLLKWELKARILLKKDLYSSDNTASERVFFDCIKMLFSTHHIDPRRPFV